MQWDSYLDMFFYKNILQIFTPKFIRFLLTGIINTIFGYGLYTLLIEIQIPYLFALFLATIGGIFFNFLSFASIVFKVEVNYFLFYKFITTYSVVYSVNALLLIFIMNNFSLDPLMGQLICMPICISLNWIIFNKWVYKKVYT